MNKKLYIVGFLLASFGHLTNRGLSGASGSAASQTTVSINGTQKTATLMTMGLVCMDFTEGADMTITATWYDAAYVGQEVTILYTVTLNSGTSLSNNYFEGFVPGGAKVSCPSVIPPVASSYLSFESFGTPLPPNGSCTCDSVNPGYLHGFGLWQFGNPTMGVGIPYTMTVTFTVTECGVYTFSPAFVGNVGGSNGPATWCIDISIAVAPLVELPNVAAGPICQGTTLTGTLPPPVCTAQQGYYTAYTGCPPCCPSAEPCPGCVTCSGYTGPCGPQPFYYVVANGIGGTVTLLNMTAGIFQFVPYTTFYGEALFGYNAVSAWSPPIFAPALTNALYYITYAQNPIASSVSLTGCAGQAFTGSLSPYVTGGSGNYSYSGIGQPSCGSVSISPTGIFFYTAPSGPAGATCTFVYEATDNTAPHCFGTGAVTVTVNALPVATDATVSTCLGQSVSGTLNATGGNPPYTFEIVAGPINGGSITFFDPTTGDFTYAPNPAAVTFYIDSFTFNVIDSNGCVSNPSGIETIDVNSYPVTSSTAVYGCQNTQLSGSLIPLVTGGTGPLVFSQSGSGGSPAMCGAFSINPSGTYTFQPSYNFTGTCCFPYYVTQGGCPGTGPHTVCVDVRPASTATGSIFNVCPSGSVTGNLNNNIISAVPPVTFNLSGTGFGGNITSFSSTSGEYSFNSNISQGTAGFNFYLTDSLPCPSATQTISVIVHPAPTTTEGQVAGCSNQVISGNLNPQVMGNAPFTFTGPFLSLGGSTVIDSNGIFFFTPTPGVTGGMFTYEVTSVWGCTGFGSELIVVNPAPTATGSTGTACALTPKSGSLVPLVSGGTPPYVFSLASVPVDGTVTISPTGIYNFTPSAGAVVGSFNYKVVDAKGCNSTATVTIDVNPGPQANTGYFTGCEGGVFGELISLVTGVGPFTFTAPVGPVFNGSVTLTNTSNGSFIFVPSILPPGQGSFNYQVTDSSIPPCTSQPKPVFINIVEGPQANPAHFTGCENQPFSGSLAPFVTGGTPPYSFFFTGAVPGCASSIIIETNGELIFVPALNFSGPCSFDYGVTDAIPCESISSVTVDVEPTPIAGNSGPFTGCANNPFSGNLTNFMLSGTPPFMFTGGNTINGTLNLLLTGPFTFTPTIAGAASFQYSATDLYDCQSTTGTISFNAQVSPILTGTSTFDTCSSTAVTSTVVASGATIPYTFSIVAGSAVNGTATITKIAYNTASFTFTPNVTSFPTPTVVGSVIVRVTAANGCYADLPITITIHQSPTAASTGLGSCAPVFNGSLTGLVSGGVPPYTFSQFNGFNPPGCGSVVINSSGTYTFTAGGTGPCTFYYQVMESSVSACTATGAVTITTSIPPVATGTNLCACVNVPVTINLNTLVAGGVPPYTFAIVGTPVGGTVFLNPTTGVATFSPTIGFNGIASFQFQAFDSFNPPCASNVATVTIQVPCCVVAP